MKHIQRLILAALICLLTSCPPEQRLGWSPDGKLGVIIGPEGLQVLDAEGALGAIIAPKVDAFVWLPDNRSLLLIQKIKVATWGEAKALLPASEIQTVERLAQALPNLYRAGIQVAGEKGGLDEQVLKAYGINLESGCPEMDSVWVAAMMAADAQVLKAIAQEMKQKDDAVEIPNELEISELALIHLNEQGGRIGESQVVERMVRPISGLSVQPQGELVAYLRGRTAIVRQLAQPLTWEVPDVRGASCAWSPDGGTLYSAGLLGAGGAPSLASLTSRRIACKNGEWLATKPETLVEVLLEPSGVPTVLPDGRILFTSHELRLAEANPSRESLFCLDPVSKLTTPISCKQGLPSLINGFSVSASGRSVAILHDGRSSVAVLELATGELVEIATVDGWDCQALLEWRGEELYYATATSKDAPHPDLMRWKLGSTAQKVSTSWPDELRDSLMTRKKSEEEAKPK